ncbi:anti-sigma factor [Paenibacillus sp. S150]|uniref:anti-sigma factor n=1 Tax=Paenibacillus sp. S150 TaxID=2749826 RepID=UPI001C598136|nr:anti-sigma factor [Paenibacillus sp. S150]MBW4083498.1 anti-sigma factor [Paenibacillus sp. S150]
MSEGFKEKLRLYSEGKLPEAEREEVEQELEKLEAYQIYLEEQMEQEDQSQGWRKKNLPPLAAPVRGKEKRIVRRGKWRARFVNTFTVLTALLAFTIISSIITAVFYAAGDRTDTYRDVISSAIAVSRPNTEVYLSANAKYFFRMELSGRLQKQIGGEQADAGEYTQNFLFGLSGPGIFNWTDAGNAGNFYFFYPDAAAGSGSGSDDSREWKKLNKLPEGTVAEAYLSFDHLFTTDELLKTLEPLELLPVWFAADTGQRSANTAVTAPLGFPYMPIWHEEDAKVTQLSGEKTGWFSSVTTRSVAYPSVEAYGDGELRNDNFIKTLKLLQQHKSLARKAAPFIRLDEAVSYVEEQGVQLYGAVVTGPVKELLKLQENSWLSNIRIGEVQLWNWH